MFVVQSERGLYFMLEILFVMLLVGVLAIGIMFLERPYYKSDVALSIAHANDLIRILSYLHKADHQTVKMVASKIFSKGNVSVYVDGVLVYKIEDFKANECFSVKDKVLVSVNPLKENEVMIEVCR